MKYKVGDKVRIKSLDWYNENSDDDYNVVFADGWHFSEPMSIFCGKDLIIEKISHATNPPHYMMKDNTFGWTDDMIEGLVEEEVFIKANDIYNEEYSKGEYCHEQSFKWGFQEGAEWMQRKMINKVCEWLKSQLNDNVTYEAVGLYGDKVIISEEGLENFRKTMKE